MERIFHPDAAGLLGFIDYQDFTPGLREVALAVGSVGATPRPHSNWIGSGFLLEVNGRDYIVSARHVFTEDGEPGGKFVPRTIGFPDTLDYPIDEGSLVPLPDKFSKNDILVARAPEDLEIKPLKLSARKLKRVPRVNRLVATLGYTMGTSFWPRLFYGSIESIKGWEIDIDMSIDPGASGGPLIDDMGEVLGVTVARGVIREDIPSGFIWRQFAVATSIRELSEVL